MFISVNCENGSSFCFEVKILSYSQETGLSIHGQDENFFVFVDTGGNIETADSIDSVKIESVELPNFSFFQSDKEPGKIVITSDDNKKELVSIEDLYHRIKRILFNS